MEAAPPWNLQKHHRRFGKNLKFNLKTRKKQMESLSNQRLEDLSQDFISLHHKLEHHLNNISQQYKGVVVALSGGVDSTVLFYLFLTFAKRKKNFLLAISHINFGLRDKESELDESFIKDLGVNWDVPVFVKKKNLDPSRLEKKTGVQLWARRVRYQEFEKLARQGWIIALAHHQDDLAENTILRLARGTSPGSMAGMQEWSAPFWRPLLEVNKENLIKIANRHDLLYREDSTNAKMDYSRNVIRHQILPVLESLYPGASQRIARCALEAWDLGESVTESFSFYLKDRERSKIPRSWFLEQKKESLILHMLSQLLGPLKQGRKAVSSRFLKKASELIKDLDTSKQSKQVLQVPASNLDLLIDEDFVYLKKRSFKKLKQKDLHLSPTWKQCFKLGPESSLKLALPQSFLEPHGQTKSLQIKNKKNRPLHALAFKPKLKQKIRFFNNNRFWTWKELMVKNKISEQAAREALLFAEILPNTAKTRMVGVGCWLNGSLQLPNDDGLFNKNDKLLSISACFAK